MDAKEFVVVADRMCNSFNSCYECLCEGKGYCAITLDEKFINHAEDAIKLVEEWAKEHPISKE